MALIATNTPMDKLVLNRYRQRLSGGGNVPLGEVCGSVELFHATKGSSAACAASLPELHAQGTPCAQESLLSNGWSWGEHIQQRALSNSGNSQKTKQDRI